LLSPGVAQKLLTGLYGFCRREVWSETVAD
jgi:hypothetical protein